MNKCPVCKQEVGVKGIAWHLKNIHEITVDGILDLLFELLAAQHGVHPTKGGQS